MSFSLFSHFSNLQSLSQWNRTTVNRYRIKFGAITCQSKMFFGERIYYICVFFFDFVYLFILSSMYYYCCCLFFVRQLHNISIILSVLFNFNLIGFPFLHLNHFITVGLKLWLKSWFILMEMCPIFSGYWTWNIARWTTKWSAKEMWKSVIS